MPLDLLLKELPEQTYDSGFYVIHHGAQALYSRLLSFNRPLNNNEILKLHNTLELQISKQLILRTIGTQSYKFTELPDEERNRMVA